MAGEYVVTSYVAEALTNSSGAARVTSFSGEALHSGNPATPARVTSFAVEVLRSTAVYVPPKRRRATTIPL